MWVGDANVKDGKCLVLASSRRDLRPSLTEELPIKVQNLNKVSSGLAFLPLIRKPILVLCRHIRTILIAILIVLFNI